MFRKLLSFPGTLVLSRSINITNSSKTFLFSPHLSDPVAISRMFCSNQPANVATYDDVKRAASINKKVLIIDVREPTELQETGILPGSINIPLGEIESVLKDCPPEQFLNKYGKEKPTKDSQIIFSCKSGKRSALAQAMSEQLGFQCVKNYSGGWLEWEEKSKTV